jgi:hypothetical protein
MSKQTSYSKIYRPDVRARPRLPCGRIFTRERVFILRADGKKMRPHGCTNASVRMRQCVRPDAPMPPRGHKCVRANPPMHPRRNKHVHADGTTRPRGHRRIRFTSPPRLPPIPSLALRGRAHASARTQRGRSKNKKLIF